jgi:hypothetical protein
MRTRADICRAVAAGRLTVRDIFLQTLIGFVRAFQLQSEVILPSLLVFLAQITPISASYLLCPGIGSVVRARCPVRTLKPENSFDTYLTLIRDYISLRRYIAISCWEGLRRGWHLPRRDKLLCAGMKKS